MNYTVLLITGFLLILVIVAVVLVSMGAAVGPHSRFE